MERRALGGLIAGLAGLAFGVAAAVLASPALAVMAAACALGAGAASVAMVQRVQEAEQRAARPAPAHGQPVPDAEPEPVDGEGRAPLLDPETGLPDRRFFDLAFQGRVAAARRHLWPVTVVMLQLGLSDDAARDPEARTSALGTFAGLLRETLREADIACRIGETTIGLVLEDTSEEGGVWTAERLQIALAKDVGHIRRLAAGVASYPSHGLHTEEIMTRAQVALDRACAAEPGHGLGHVEVAHLDLA